MYMITCVLVGTVMDPNSNLPYWSLHPSLSTAKYGVRINFRFILIYGDESRGPFCRQVSCLGRVWSIFLWLWSLTHSHKHFVVPKINILDPENWETGVNLIEFLNNQTENQKSVRQKSVLLCFEGIHSVIYSNMFVCREKKIQIWRERESRHEKSLWFPWSRNETVDRPRASQIRVKNVFSCSDPVETSIIKMISWKLMIFDRFIDIEFTREMSYSFFQFSFFWVRIRVPVMIEVTVGGP